MDSKKETENQRKNRLLTEIKTLEHLEKLYKYLRFRDQIANSDITAGYMNRIKIL